VEILDFPLNIINKQISSFEFQNMLNYKKRQTEKPMKTLLKVILSVLVFLIIFLTLIPLFLLLSVKQGVALGLSISGAALGLIFYSIYGLILGKTHMSYFKGRPGTLGLLFISIFLIPYSMSLAAINDIIEEDFKAGNPSFSEKARMLANFVPVGYMEDLKEVKFNEVTIRYPEGKEDTVQMIKDIYPEALAENEKYFGSIPLEPLTIFIYPSEEFLTKYTSLEGIGGYYKDGNASIHMLSAEQYKAENQFLEMFRHEFAHYITFMFLEHHDIKKDNVPNWFIEGIAGIIGKDGMVDIAIETISFNQMDSSSDFHDARNDHEPYLQSYYAVRELVIEHGDEVISNLIKASAETDFYDGFHQVVGLTIDEFEDILMVRKQRIEELINLAGEAEKNKNYVKAESLFLEAIEMEPDNFLIYGMLPHNYIKQQKFNDAVSLIENKLLKLDPYYNYYQLLSELYLLKDLNQSLAYAEKFEENTGNGGDYSDRWLEAIGKLNSERSPESYIKLLEDDLINYNEIKRELYKKISLEFPNDTRLRELSKDYQ
jgi:tetratricopeptide (TPR) repeat protein